MRLGREGRGSEPQSARPARRVEPWRTRRAGPPALADSERRGLRVRECEPWRSRAPSCSRRRQAAPGGLPLGLRALAAQTASAAAASVPLHTCTGQLPFRQSLAIRPEHRVGEDPRRAQLHGWAGPFAAQGIPRLELRGRQPGGAESQLPERIEDCGPLLWAVRMPSRLRLPHLKLKLKAHFAEVALSGRQDCSTHWCRTCFDFDRRRRGE